METIQTRVVVEDGIRKEQSLRPRFKSVRPHQNKEQSIWLLFYFAKKGVVIMGGRGAVSIKMSLDEFLGRRGLASPVSDYSIDKVRGNRQLKTTRGENKFRKEVDKANNSYHEQRQSAVSEYNEKVSQGKIKPKSSIERALDTAHGHPDNSATQAARRILEKKGIDWKTGKKIK